jgi:uncharacterized protein (TIGR02569 family)
MPIGPPASVLRAFRVPELAALVPGGQGVTYRAGDMALKPCDDPAEAEWLASVLSGIHEHGFRIARPIRASSGRFVEDGWCASCWVEGTTSLSGRWPEAIEAIRAFHRALRHVPKRPEFDDRKNLYALADRIAWQEAPLSHVPALGADIQRLIRCLRPVTATPQLIHGDPSEGNLLFHDGLPPAIIDVAPYWRPAEYAIATFVADAIAWSAAPHFLLETVRLVPEMDQLLARAVLFRVIVSRLFHPDDNQPAVSRTNAYLPVIDAVEQWTQRR